MKKSFCWVLFGAAFFSSKSLLGNWQCWSHYEIVNSIDNNLDFKIKPEFRCGNNFNDHYYTHFDMGFDWGPTDWFVFAPYYRHVNEKRNGSWSVEYRPHLNATFKWKVLSYFNLSDRGRLEFRIKEDKTTLRYTNQFTLKMSKITKLELQPFIAEEFFYDFASAEFNKNRVYAGTDFKVIKNLKVGLYYILESSKRDNAWATKNVLQTSLKYNF